MTHPSHTMFKGITDTLSRIQRVHDLVKVYLPVIQRYQCVRYNEFKSMSTPEPMSADTEPFYDTL